MAWVPHTIPKKVMKAYSPGSMRDDPEALQRQYKGRILRSEDPDWQTGHEDLEKEKKLKEKSLNLIVDNYEYMVTLVREQNKVSYEQWEKEKAEWEDQLQQYKKRKDSFDKRKLALELLVARKAFGNLEDDFDDNNDDDDGETNEMRLANLKEPEEVAESFKPFIPQMMILDRVTNFERMVIIEELNDLVIPFEMAVETIPDDYYWERSALKKWPTICKDTNTTWRQTYMETHLNHFLEEFHPWDGDLKELEDLVNLLRYEISSVSLTQLIPICYGIPAKPVEDPPQGADVEVAKGADADLDEGIGELSLEMEAQARNMTIPALQQEYLTKMREAKAIKFTMPTDANGEEEQDEEEAEEHEKLVPPGRYDSSHIDLTLVLPKLETLVKVSLIYDIQEIGLDWEERLATFTDRDCINLAKALATSASIEIFELNKSHLSGEQCKTLVREGFIKMPHLKSLNLAYNRIGDVGAKALSRLLIDKESCAQRTLHTLKLCRNEIHNRGAKALAFALSINSYLTELDLRLNFIKNAGGEDFGHGLAENKSLQVLLLGGNRLGADACYVLGKMLMINETLIYLDLSSNTLEEKGGEFLAVGMRNNKTLLKLDVRLSKIGFQFESDVMVHLKKNRAKLDYSLIDMEDYYPPEFEQEIPADDLEGMGSEDEEEEEEDEVQVLKPAKSKHHTSSESDV